MSEFNWHLVELFFFSTGKTYSIVFLSFFSINQFNPQVASHRTWPADQGYVVHTRPTARHRFLANMEHFLYVSSCFEVTFITRGGSRRKSGDVVIRLQSRLRKMVWVDGWVHKTLKRIYRTAFSLFPPSVNLFVLTWTQFLPYLSSWRQSSLVLKKCAYFNQNLDPFLNYRS